MTEELVDIISCAYTTDEILDILDMDTKDLCKALEERILDNIYKFTEVQTFYNGL